MKKLKRITATKETYIGDFCGYEVFTVGWAFENNPKNNDLITQEIVEMIIEAATYIKDVDGMDPSWNFDNATRGHMGDFRFSLDWDNKQILVYDD